MVRPHPTATIDAIVRLEFDEDESAPCEEKEGQLSVFGQASAEVVLEFLN
jgi:hypothetical protein